MIIYNNLAIIWYVNLLIKKEEEKKWLCISRSAKASTQTWGLSITEDEQCVAIASSNKKNMRHCSG